MIDGSEGLRCGGDGFSDGFFGSDVHDDAEDAGLGEFGGEFVDGRLGGANCGFEVPEGEARAAVFEEGAGGREGEGAGAAGDYGRWRG